MKITYLDEINNGTLYQIEGGMFKYALQIFPIDSWELIYPLEKLIELSKDYGEYEKYCSYNDIKTFVNEVVTKYSQLPSKSIGFIGIPKQDEYLLNIVIIAKSDNNGDTYLFSDDLYFLKCVCN